MDGNTRRCDETVETGRLVILASPQERTRKKNRKDAFYRPVLDIGEMEQRFGSLGLTAKEQQNKK